MKSMMKFVLVLIIATSSTLTITGAKKWGQLKCIPFSNRCWAADPQARHV